MMGTLWGMIIPAIAPAVIDGLRGIFAKFTGGAGGMPQNVNERIQLMEAETNRLRALAEIDKPAENIDKWVANTRAIFRYGAVGLILLVTGVAVLGGGEAVPQDVKLMLLDLSGACMSFIIGERFYFRLKG